MDITCLSAELEHACGALDNWKKFGWSGFWILGSLSLVQTSAFPGATVSDSSPSLLLIFDFGVWELALEKKALEALAGKVSEYIERNIVISGNKHTYIHTNKQIFRTAFLYKSHFTIPNPYPYSYCAQNKTETNSFL